MLSNAVEDDRTPKNSGSMELILMVAFLMALVPLTVDTLIPAQDEIGKTFGIERHDYQSLHLVITLAIVGMGIGQLVFGPLSDFIGRKPTVYVGLILYIVGTVLAILSTSFCQLMVARLIQGFGMASPRVVSVAIVRDLYRDVGMAQIMSWVMAINVIVPTIAPGIGQAVLELGDWQGVFGLTLVFSAGMLFWFSLRQRETIKLVNRHPFSLATLISSFIETLTHPVSTFYLLCMGCNVSCVIGFFISSKRIFSDFYRVESLFPLYFACITIFAAFASFSNGFLVKKIAVEKLTWYGAVGAASSSILIVIVSIFFLGIPPCWVLMIYFAVSFFCFGIMSSNLTTLAIGPLGHIAGTGAAVVGATSTLIGAVLGGVIGSSYNRTIFPLAIAIAALNLLCLPLIAASSRSKMYN